MFSIKNSLIIATTVASLASCVTQKKYDRLLSDKVKLEGDNAACNDSLTQYKNTTTLYKSEAEKLAKENKNLKDDTSLTNSSFRRTKALYTEEVGVNERLKKDYKTLLDNSSAESSNLTKNLLRKEDELHETAKKNAALSESLNKLSADLKARELRVKDLELVLANKDKAVNELKARVSEALLNFKDKDLTINVKNGKVYVSLAEQLLFKSGSIEVDKKGAEAIKKLASVLKEQKDINVMVEGHTDDVPMKGTNCIADNWDLSVLRATSIVKIITNEGVDPKKLSPCGRGEYSPVAEAKTAEARQKNRRTEIILTPKLDELFKILETN
jgi:chemotaxis protein MotB